MRKRKPRWSGQDREALGAAFDALEHPSFAARVTDLVGTPVEMAIEALPKTWQTKIQAASRKALDSALTAALKTMNGEPSESPALSRALHKVAVVLTGAAGGAGGAWTVTVELPVTTTIMLRSIADIARAEGEDLKRPAAHLACIEVFALGGPSKSDDASETGYFAVRATLARAVSEAAEFILEKGLAEEGAPILVRLITRVAQRFSVQVSEKVAAEAVPVIGALGGATINFIFIDHFQSMARGHFTVRRLERKYGKQAVRAAYDALRAGTAR